MLLRLRILVSLSFSELNPLFATHHAGLLSAPAEKENAELRQRYISESKERRLLYNKILEMKGKKPCV